MNPMNQLALYRPYGQQAEGSVTVAEMPTAGNTVTINGDVYTFGTTFEGSTRYQVAANLAAAINAERNIYGHRHNQTTLIRLYAAQYFGTIVKIFATAPGTAGNAITLATNNATAFTVSGATLADGAAGTSVVMTVGSPSVAAATELTFSVGTVTLGAGATKLNATELMVRYLYIHVLATEENINIGDSVSQTIPVVKGGGWGPIKVEPEFKFDIAKFYASGTVAKTVEFLYAV